MRKLLPPQRYETSLNVSAFMLNFISWIFVVGGGLMFAFGLVLLAHPAWNMNFNGVETAAIGPKLIFTLFPLIHVTVGGLFLWRGNQFLCWFWNWRIGEFYEINCDGNRFTIRDRLDRE